MKFTLNWLREFVRFEGAPEKLAELLTMAGLEVESVVLLQEPETGGEDWLFEVAVTPNRGDCLSVMGLAREVSALTGAGVKSKMIRSRVRRFNALAGITLEIQDLQACPRYSARVVERVRIGPSPASMRFRLDSCGVRSINNIVDITNYVMLETGQPLHAFDLDRLNGGRIVVRRAEGATKFITLDGIERELAAEDLVICDGDKPVALAGIMGGADSEVTPETRRILLESAHFDPLVIRRTAKRLGLRTEASYRFERAVDPAGTLVAANRAVELFAAFADARAVSGMLDCYPRRCTPSSILLREGRLEKLLGVHIERGAVDTLLRSLGLRTSRRSRKGIIEVFPPTSRPDLTREADLIEEVARLYGYDKVPTTVPAVAASGAKVDQRLRWERKLRCFLDGEGVNEVVNLPFTSEKMNRAFFGVGSGLPAPVIVVNPLVKENAEMRLSLIPGLLDNLRLNLSHKAANFFGFHLGKVFRLSVEGEPEERQYLAGVLYGRREQKGLHSGDAPTVGFLDCKGLVEGILDLLRIGELAQWSSPGIAALHPGRSAIVRFDGEEVGYLGQSHPGFCDAVGLPSFLAFELDFEKLVKYAPRQTKARSLPRYPAVERDFAVVVDRGFPSQQIVNWIKGLGQTLIEHVSVFDEYFGTPLPEGKKSLAYKISYRANDRTLTDNEVNALHKDLVARIGEVFGAQLRS
jgi:phenylalanyl-tRNA synthetase beta chain